MESPSKKLVTTYEPVALNKVIGDNFHISIAGFALLTAREFGLKCESPFKELAQLVSEHEEVPCLDERQLEVLRVMNEYILLHEKLQDLYPETYKKSF